VRGQALNNLSRCESKHIEHILVCDGFPTKGNDLVKHRLSIAQTSIRPARNGISGFGIEINTLLAGNEEQVFCNELVRDPAQVEALAAACDRGGDFVRLCGGKDKLHMRRWLLKGFQEGIECTNGEHVHLVDEINFVGAAHRTVLRVVAEITDVFHAIIAGTVDFHDVHVVALGDFEAGRTFTARVRCRSLLAIQSLCQNSCGRGFPDSARPDKKVGLRKAVLANGILQSAGNVFLTHNLFKGRGTVFSGKNTIAHEQNVTDGMWQAQSFLKIFGCACAEVARPARVPYFGFVKSSRLCQAQFRPVVTLFPLQMNKLINNPLNVADELLEGLVQAYNGECKYVGTRSIVKTQIPDNKVALLVGGGSGHEPIYHGLVGRNLADGAACGDIFAAPPPNVVFEATEAVNRGNGVLYLYGNYSGDAMNFDLGGELAEDSGIKVRTVRIWDDVCAAPPTRKKDRRGIAGLVLIVKLTGAASQVLTTLEELEAVAQKAVLQTRTVGISTAAGSIPATGKPTFELAPDKVGLGMGLHGEPGVGEIPMATIDELIPKILALIFEDFEKDGEVEALQPGDEVILLVNSLGSTTMMELLIALRCAKKCITEKGIKIYDVMVGPFATCQEMSGLSLSLTRVDEELKKYWDMPCQSVCFSKMQGRNGG